MTDIKLEIAGVLLDVSGQSGIALTFAVQDFRDPGSRSAGFSYTISLPATDEVHRLFHHVADLQTNPLTAREYDQQNFKPLTPRPEPIGWAQPAAARMVVDGIAVFEGLARLLKVRVIDSQVAFYDIQLIGDRARWATLAGQLELKDIERFDVIECWNYARYLQLGLVLNGSDPDDLICVPLIEYGGLRSLMVPPLNSDQIDIENLYPAVWLKALLVHGFAQLGYRLFAPILDRYNFQHLCIPFCNPRFENIFAQLNEPGYAAQMAPEPPSVWVDLPFSPTVVETSARRTYVLQSLPPYPPTFAFITPPDFGNGDFGSGVGYEVPTDFVCGPASFRIRLSIAYRIEIVTPGFNPLNNIDLWTFVRSTSGSVIQEYTNLGSPFEGIHFHDIEGDVVAGPGDIIYVQSMANPLNYTRMGVRIHIELFEFEILSHPWKRENYKFRIADNLPKGVNFLQVVRGIMNQFNLIATSDEVRREVRLLEYQDFYTEPEALVRSGPNGTPEVVADWSALADDNSREDTLTAATLPGLLRFRYREDDDWPMSQKRAAAIEYENFDLDNPNATNRQSSAQISAAPFAAFENLRMPEPTANLIPAYFASTPPNELPTGDDTEVGLRLGFYRIDQAQSFLIAYNNIQTIGVSPWTPNFEFVGPLGDLRFANLYQQFYRRMYDLLFRSRTTSLPVRLRASDLARLDLGRPVRIGTQWYYLNKIDKYNPADQAATEVELIQIR